MAGQSTISVLLPVMNEISSLNQTIDIIRSRDPHRNFEFIVILSERSEPSAIKNAQDLQRSAPDSVTVLFQSRPLLGGALMDAIDVASGSYILMMASDLETDPDAVQAILKESDAYPESIIATTRWRGDGAGFEGYGAGKKWANKVFQASVRAMFSSSLTDLTYGFRLYPSGAVQNQTWETYNHGFLLESILRPMKSGWSVREIPVTWRARSEGVSSNSWRFYKSYFTMAAAIRFGDK